MANCFKKLWKRKKSRSNEYAPLKELLGNKRTELPCVVQLENNEDFHPKFGIGEQNIDNTYRDRELFIEKNVQLKFVKIEVVDLSNRKPDDNEGNAGSIVHDDIQLT